MNTRIFRLVVFTLLLLAGTANTQTTTATLTGSVTDSSGATVPGAVVTVTNMATGIARRIPTSDAGYYTAALLPPGNYQIRIEKEGFRAVARTGITLNVDQVARLDFTLEVGTISEAIDVTSAAVVGERIASPRLSAFSSAKARSSSVLPPRASMAYARARSTSLTSPAPSVRATP